MTMRTSWVLWLLVSFLWSCNRDQSTVSPYIDSRSYIPSLVGSYIIYNVVDTTFNIGKVVIPAVYQLKIRVAEKMNTSSVLEKYTLERYKRTSPADSWQLDSIWFREYTNDKLLLEYELNIPYVKMPTPLKSSSVWNGNQFNTKDAEIYKIRSFEKPYFLVDSMFPNTVKVVQNDDFFDALGYTNKYEVYAKGLGLLYKYDAKYNYSSLDTVINTEERIGFIREMTYVAKGKD